MCLFTFRILLFCGNIYKPTRGEMFISWEFYCLLDSLWQLTLYWERIILKSQNCEDGSFKTRPGWFGTHSCISLQELPLQTLQKYWAIRMSFYLTPVSSSLLPWNMKDGTESNKNNNIILTKTDVIVSCKMNWVVKQQAFVDSAVPQTLPPFICLFLEVRFSFLQIMFLSPHFQK